VPHLNLWMTPGSEQSVGIFGFWSEDRKQSSFIGISGLWTGVLTVEGKRCLEVSREQGWTHVRTLSRRLEAFRFDRFPRGRLE